MGGGAERAEGERDDALGQCTVPLVSLQSRTVEAQRRSSSGFRGAAVAIAVALAACAGQATGSIGAVLGRRADGRLFVRDAPVERSGAQAGLSIGDEIVAVDDVPVTGLDAAAIQRSLRGPVGTTVRLRVARDGEEITVVVTRAPFAAASR